MSESENKRVSAKNPKGYEAPDDVMFVDLWEKSEHLDDFRARMEKSERYLCYATIRSTVERLNAALGENPLKAMPRKPRSPSKSKQVDVEAVSAVIARVRAAQEKAAQEVAQTE